MGKITEEGLKKHIGDYAELCTPEGNFNGQIIYKPNLGFYVGDSPIEDMDVLILRPDILRVNFLRDGLID